MSDFHAPPERITPRQVMLAILLSAIAASLGVAIAAMLAVWLRPVELAL